MNSKTNRKSTPTPNTLIFSLLIFLLFFTINLGFAGPPDPFDKFAPPGNRTEGIIAGDVDIEFDFTVSGPGSPIKEIIVKLVNQQTGIIVTQKSYGPDFEFKVRNLTPGIYTVDADISSMTSDTCHPVVVKLSPRNNVVSNVKLKVTVTK